MTPRRERTPGRGPLGVGDDELLAVGALGTGLLLAGRAIGGDGGEALGALGLLTTLVGAAVFFARLAAVALRGGGR